MQLIVVCLLGVLLSSLSLSQLYQAYLSHTMAVFCVQKEQMNRLAEGAQVYAIARYRHADKKIRLILESKKSTVIEYELPVLLADQAIRMIITYKVLGIGSVSIDTLVLCGSMRERIVRKYNF